MTDRTTNAHGQPVGRPLPAWQPCPFPDVGRLSGAWATVEPLTTAHAAELHPEVCGRDDDPLWTYSARGPFADAAEFGSYVEATAEDTGVVALTIRDSTGVACGIAHLLAIRPEHGVLELGAIVLGRRLQRTTASTEAMYLILRHVFDLGYRRCEWKCDSLNEPSRRAAERLGFRFEGRFHHAVVVKGRNRDTDWFALTDDSWPPARAALEAWLEPANHDDRGRQRRSLAELRGG